MIFDLRIFTKKRINNWKEKDLNVALTETVKRQTLLN